MSLEPELLWSGILLLLLLGAAAGLCVRCSHPGSKKSGKIYEQRNLHADQQSFAVARTYSLVEQVWSGSLVDEVLDSAQRKDKLLQFSPSARGSESPRYQNFCRGSRHGSEAAYVEPITADYYNWGQSQKVLEEEDDSSSYQNVLICKPSSAKLDDEDSEDYQNSTSIQHWRESRRFVELVLSEVPSPACSPDEDGSEPDYVNGDVESGTT